VAYSRVQNYRPVSRYISEIVQGINVVTIELSEDLIASSDVETPLPAHTLLFAFPVSTSNCIYIDNSKCQPRDNEPLRKGRGHGHMIYSKFWGPMGQSCLAQASDVNFLHRLYQVLAIALR